MSLGLKLGRHSTADCRLPERGRWRGDPGVTDLPPSTEHGEHRSGVEVDVVARDEISEARRLQSWRPPRSRRSKGALFCAAPIAARSPWRWWPLVSPPSWTMPATSRGPLVPSDDLARLGRCVDRLARNERSGAGSTGDQASESMTIRRSSTVVKGFTTHRRSTGSSRQADGTTKATCSSSIRSLQSR